MKILFYSPYFPKHTGGGEKYLLDCASMAAAAGHQVFMAVSTTQPLTPFQEKQIRQKYEQFFNQSLAQLQFVAVPFGTMTSAWKKLLFSRKFDCIYYQTDGSLFFSLAKRNILHIQVPLHRPPQSMVEKLKLANWSIKNTNSEFTKKYVEQFWQTEIAYVHHPFVDQKEFANKAAQKEKIILNVGRFFAQLHSKRQDVLLDIFRQLRANNPELLQGWKLVFIGAVEDQQYFHHLEMQAKDLPVKFLTDVNRSTILQYYQHASFYWHATGYGVDQDEHPEKMEHFGISVLEAMAAGAVPVVINKGGLPEILGKDLSSLLWDTPDDCQAMTSQLLAHPNLWQQKAKLAQARSQVFSPAHFRSILLRMLEDHL